MLTVGETCRTRFGPAAGVTDGTFHTSGATASGTLISASKVSQNGNLKRFRPDSDNFFFFLPKGQSALNQNVQEERSTMDYD